MGKVITGPRASHPSQFRRAREKAGQRGQVRWDCGCPLAQTSGHFHLSSFGAPVPITHRAQTLTSRRNLNDHLCPPIMHLPLRAVCPPATRDPHCNEAQTHLILSDEAIGFLGLLPLEEDHVLQGSEGQGLGRNPARHCEGKVAQGRGKAALEPGT